MKLLNLDTDYLSRTYHLSNIHELWNAEVGEDFYLSYQLFKQNVSENDDISYRDSYLCYVNSNLVGFILIKHWTDAEKISKHCDEKVWISLFYVAKAYRNKGIGSQLFKTTEEQLKERGFKSIELGKDTYNFFPGLPKCFHESESFFLKNGFVRDGVSYDLMRHELTKDVCIDYEAPKYTIRYATNADFSAIDVFFNKAFPGRWTYEFHKYVRTGEDGRAFVIMLYKDKVIGFCRVNHSKSLEQLNNINWLYRFDNLYGIGPLGIDPDYRGQRLGFIITAYAINTSIQAGATDINIDWTSKVDFYKKFGFDVYETFISMHKELEG